MAPDGSPQRVESPSKSQEFEADRARLIKVLQMVNAKMKELKTKEIPPNKRKDEYMKIADTLTQYALPELERWKTKYPDQRELTDKAIATLNESIADARKQAARLDFEIGLAGFRRAMGIFSGQVQDDIDSPIEGPLSAAEASKAPVAPKFPKREKKLGDLTTDTVKAAIKLKSEQYNPLNKVLLGLKDYLNDKVIDEAEVQKILDVLNALMEKGFTINRSYFDDDFEKYVFIKVQRKDFNVEIRYNYSQKTFSVDAYKGGEHPFVERLQGRGVYIRKGSFSTSEEAAAFIDGVEKLYGDYVSKGENLTELKKTKDKSFWSSDEGEYFAAWSYDLRERAVASGTLKDVNLDNTDPKAPLKFYKYFTKSGEVKPNSFDGNTLIIMSGGTDCPACMKSEPLIYDYALKNPEKFKIVTFKVGQVTRDEIVDVQKKVFGNEETPAYLSYNASSGNIKKSMGANALEFPEENTFDISTSKRRTAKWLEGLFK